MTTKHTPGPWRINGDLIQSSNGDATICQMDPYGEAKDEANGRLIAAAPEMFDALQAIANSQYGVHWTKVDIKHAQKLARATIAKVA